MPDPLTSPTEDALAEAMAEKFSSPYGARNPDWDWEQPDGPENPYYFTRPLAERADGQPYVHFTATDGERSFRAATYRELASALVESGTVLPITRLTDDEDLVEQVLDAAYPEVQSQQRAAVRRDVRAVLAGLAEVLEQVWCHCGRRVAGISVESPAGHVLCEACVSVRCDAYPGACTPRS